MKKEILEQHLRKIGHNPSIIEEEDFEGGKIFTITIGRTTFKYVNPSSIEFDEELEILSIVGVKASTYIGANSISTYAGVYIRTNLK